MIEASWELNIRKIQIYCFINVIPFVCFALTSVIFPTFAPLWIINPILNIFMLLIEANEIRLLGMRYFSEVWNYLDLTGNLLSIYFILGRYFSDDR